MSDTSMVESDRERRLRRMAADLRARLRAHVPCRVEEILSSDSELAGSDDAVLELVYTEWATREELGQHPDRQDLFLRFPTLAPRLERLLLVHDGVVDDPALPADPRETWLHGRRPESQRLMGSERFEVLEELGRGGMGIVFKARQVGLERYVALKRILAGEFADQQLRTRFQVEAEASARLQHPNVVQIFEIGEDDGLPYLAMEYVEGPSLSERLRQGPLPFRRAAELVETLARAVQYAHERGVIHRDLKPANILLARNGTPKITDFGLARQMDTGQDITGSRSILGTPCYMAPEQSQGRHILGPALDVYSLGAILYEVVTGRTPFLGVTPLDTLLQVRSQEPAPLRQFQPQCPRDLETICLKCLHKEPARRFASAQALADDLRRFLDNRPIEARPTSTLERLVKWVRRRPTVAALALVLLLGAPAAITATTLLWLKAEDNFSQLQRATQSREEEHQQAERNRNLAYVKWASAACSDDDLPLARQLLEQCDPALRDREWQRLDRECRALRHEWTKFPVSLLRVVVRPNGEGAVVAGGDRVFVYDLPDAERPVVTIPYTHTLLDMIYTADGQVVLATAKGGEGIKVEFWSRGQKWEQRRVSTVAATGYIGQVSFDPDGRWLAVIEKKEVTVFDLSGGPSRTLATKGPIGPTLITVSADGNWLAGKYNSNDVWVHNLKTGEGPYTWTSQKPLHHFPISVGPGGIVAVVAYAPRDTKNTEILVVEVPHARLLHTLPQRDLMNVTLSKDGRTLIAVGGEKAVKLWNVESGALIFTLRGNPLGTRHGLFTADGSRVFTIGEDSALRLWDIPQD